VHVQSIESPSWQRVIAGFAIAPAVPGLLLYVLQAPFLESGAYLLPVVMLMYAYPLALIFGVPAYLFLKRGGSKGVVPAVCIGAAIGLLGYLVDVALTTSAAVYTDELRRAYVANSIGRCVAGVVWGAISGSVFWGVTMRAPR
jgi:hypothetical protein